MPQIPPKYIDIKTYIELHSSEPIVLETLAARAHVTPYHLVHEYSRYFHISPIEYLIQLRLHRAMILLRDPAYTITHIAALVGYDDQCYFSRLVQKRFGRSPRTLRREISRMPSDAFSSYAANVFTTTAVEWLPILDQDFSQTRSLDSRWCAYHNRAAYQQTTPVPMSEFVSIEHGYLRLLPKPWRSTLRWEAEIPEEVKIEVVIGNTSHAGPNIGLAISGDTWTGYRLRLVGGLSIELETEYAGFYEVLCQCPYSLDPTASEYTITFWRTGYSLFAEIDGQRILDYHDPLPLYGLRHHSLAISRYFDSGSADFKRIRIWSKNISRMKDILEPGRQYWSKGQIDEAHAWFQRIADNSSHGARITMTAQYLAAVTLSDTSQKREQQLQAIVDAPAQPLRLHALQQLILQYLSQGDLKGFTVLVERTYAVPALQEKILRLGDHLHQVLQQALPAQLPAILACIAQIPLTAISLDNIPLTSLTPITGMPLQSLSIKATGITDLAPVCNMPLQKLIVDNCPITDLTPLSRSPLTFMSCNDTGISDLSPLRKLPLHFLYCNQNEVTDITPLASLSQLRLLMINHNTISDLKPLGGLPLTGLYCSNNNLVDLTSLAGMPLEAFDCSYNRISNLSPLKEAPLRHLNCKSNRLTSLLPLSGMPLEILDCGKNRLTTLHPVRNAPLHHLKCTHNRITDLSLLKRLRLIELDCRDNAITSLAPLRDMPLSQVACGDNPLTDLSPLAHAPITEIDIGAIPVTRENLRILKRWQLRVFNCELTNKSAIQHASEISSLQYMNGHAVTHTLAVADVVAQADCRWRHGEPCPRALRDAIFNLAQPCGAAAYLAIPAKMSLLDAVLFCRWLGAQLASPATHTMQANLHHYLSKVGKPDAETSYLLGLTQAEDGTPRWASGAKLEWLNSISPYFTRHFLRRGQVYWSINPFPGDAFWQIDFTSQKHYVTLEWPI